MRNFRCLFVKIQATSSISSEFLIFSINLRFLLIQPYSPGVPPGTRNAQQSVSQMAEAFIELLVPESSAKGVRVDHEQCLIH